MHLNLLLFHHIFIRRLTSCYQIGKVGQRSMCLYKSTNQTSMHIDGSRILLTWNCDCMGDRPRLLERRRGSEPIETPFKMFSRRIMLLRETRRGMAFSSSAVSTDNPGGKFNELTSERDVESDKSSEVLSSSCSGGTVLWNDSGKPKVEMSDAGSPPNRKGKITSIMVSVTKPLYVAHIPLVLPKPFSFPMTVEICICIRKRGRDYRRCLDGKRPNVIPSNSLRRFVRDYVKPTG